MRIIIFIITVLYYNISFSQPSKRVTNVASYDTGYDYDHIGKATPSKYDSLKRAPFVGEPIPKVDSTQFVKLLSLKDLQIITQSLKDKMTVTEWEKVTQAIDKVYLARREEYLKSKDTAKVKK